MISVPYSYISINSCWSATEIWFFYLRYQSGFNPPDNIPFEDLSKPDTVDGSNTIHYNNIPMNHMTMKGTMGANKLKKRVGIFGIFSSNKVRNVIILCIFMISKHNIFSNIEVSSVYILVYRRMTFYLSNNLLQMLFYTV